MKKLLLLATLFGGTLLAGNAKELTFIFDGKVVSAGSVIEYSDYDVYPAGPSQNEVWIEPPLFIKSDVDSQVSFSSNSNYPIAFCIGSQCQNGEKVSIPNVGLKANEEQDLLLDVSIMVDKDKELELPAIEVTVSAWFNDEPSKVYNVTVKMGNVAAVEAVGADLNKISVSGKTLNYTLESASTLSVYSLSGKTVVSRNVSGNGSISLSNLPAGVYLYRVAGKNGKSGKFIIR